MIEKYLTNSSTLCYNNNKEGDEKWKIKNYHEVEKYLVETVDIIHRVKPVYNFKA